MSAPSVTTPADVPSPLPGSAAEADDMAGVRVTAVAGLYYLVVAVAVTMYLWRHPSATIVAGNPYDTDQFTWFFRYDATALTHLHLPGLITNSMNAPQGISVMWNTFMLLPGVLLAPVTLLAGPQVSLTVLMTLGFAGSATALFGVLRGWGVPTRLAALGGFAYGFSPALLQSAQGHYDLQFAVLLPLIASAALRLITGTYRRDPLRCGLYLGALAAAQIFIAEEMLFDTAIAVIIAAVVLVASRPRQARARIRDVATGLAAGLIFTVVVAGYPLVTQFFGPLHGSGSPFTPDYFKNDLSGFVQPSSYELIHTSQSAAFAAAAQAQLPEYLAYLGWPLLILLLVFAVVFWRVLAIRVCAVVFAVLSVFSLGGTLLAGGHEHSWLKLPWYWVQTMPIAGSVIPDRYSIVADIAAAALLGFGLTQWRSRIAHQGHLVLAVGLIALLPLIPKPLPAGVVAALPSGWRAVFTALHMPSGASVLVVPVPTSTFTEPLRWQAETNEPASLYGGYFLGRDNGGRMFLDGNGLTVEELYLNRLWAESSGEITSREASQSGATASSGGTKLAPIAYIPSEIDMRAAIRSWDPAAVMAVTSERSVLGRYLIRVLGKPQVRVGDVIAWRT